MSLAVTGLVAPAGYLGLFLLVVATGAGLPLPEDAAVLAGGYLVARGVTRLGPTIAVALVAVLLGDAFLFLVGRRLGPKLLARGWVARRVTPERLEQARAFVQRRGVVAVLVGRFVMGLRVAIFLAAGALGLPWSRFLVANGLGALVGVPLLVLLGRWAGPRLDGVAATVGEVRLGLLVVAIVGLGIVVQRRRRGAGASAAD